MIVLDQNQNNLFIETQLNMIDLKEYMNDRSIEIKELWFKLDDRNPGAEIRILFNYLYSKNFMYDQQCGEWIS